MSKFDLDKTRELEGLFKVIRTDRGENWRKQFFSAVVDASLMCSNPQVVIGPDQFPYFHLSLPSGAFEPFCISHIIDGALANVFGVCIFSDAEQRVNPEWVFSYGDMLSQRLYGSFEGDPSETTDKSAPGYMQETLTKSREILIGQPNEEYFPIEARKALGDFIRQRLGFPEPKICLIVDQQFQPTKNIAVNIGIDDVRGNENDLQAIFRVISWFLPRNYGLMSVPKPIDQSELVALP